MQLWRIATDAATYGADDLSGAGAASGGGRWNKIGTPAVYTSVSIALACIETFVHLKASGLPLNRYLVQIDVPDAVWNGRTILSPPPVGWDAIPVSLTSINAGEKWLRGGTAVLLEVPSVVVPEEKNIVINPKHADISKLKARKIRKWAYDAMSPRAP